MLKVEPVTVSLSFLDILNNCLDNGILSHDKILIAYTLKNYIFSV